MAVPASYGRRADAAPVRLMLVDDSIVARSVAQAIVAPLAEFTVVATASSAEQALAQIDKTPVDIVMLDLAMPGMDGLTALPEIVRRSRGARVLVVSASAGAGADACVRALTLGAADTLEKPRAGAFGTTFRDDLIDKLRRIAADIPSRDPIPAVRAAPLPSDPLRAPVAGPIGCIAIGASTGGLHALSALLRALPAACTAPILITQHLPATFMPYFAAQIADIALRPATVARDGDRLRAGRILIAPGDAHIGLQPYCRDVRIALDRVPAASGCLPSVDPMLDAVARLYGAQAFAVVLTGMGRDGVIGARRLAEAGGEVAAQDRASSVVWGMPGSVATAGLAATIAEPARIAARIAERCGAPTPASGTPR